MAWIFCFVLFVLSVSLFNATLPERVATHFGAGGRADGWTSREAYLWQVVGSGVVLSSLVIGLCYLVRFLPPSCLNGPHAEYWRAPENYRRACSFLFTASYWYASLLLLWRGGLHYLTIQANQVRPPTLGSGGLGLLTAALLVGSGIWMVAVVRFFSKAQA